MRPINLLPRADRRDGRRRVAVVAGVVLFLVYLGLLGVAVVWREGRVVAARDDLAAQEALNASLERELAALAPARELRDQYAQRADFVRVALAGDVDWGLLLNDLGRLIPPRLWVETFSGTVGGAGTTGAPGRVAFSGIGFDFPDVSEWLRALNADQFGGVTGTWVSSIARGLIGDSEIVDFNSTAVLTPDASSGRAERLIPEVP